MDFKAEMIKSIKTVIYQELSKCKQDRTYRSVIKAITPKGYVVPDNAGSERTVQCCIPNMELKIGQSVWLKEPMGDLKGLHICGVDHGNQTKRGRR